LEPSDALVATIEASIALAGFSGIVVVLGRRSQGEWRPQEELRLINLLGASFQAFVVSLLGILLLSAKLPAATSWVVCSAAWFLATGLHMGWVIVRSRRLDGQEDLSKTHPLFFWTSGALVLFVLLLQLANIASLRQFWPVLAGIVTNLTLGARQFVVLLRSGHR
jgi:hypothetical protein